MRLRDFSYEFEDDRGNGQKLREGERFRLPPMSMVRQMRMERARRLLEQGDGLPMKTVARRVGFSTVTRPVMLS